MMKLEYFGKEMTTAKTFTNAKNWLTGKDPDAGEILKAGGKGDNKW